MSVVQAVLRDAVAGDAAAIAEIYNHYVAHTVVTFEEEPVAASEMAERVRAGQEKGLPFLVAEQRGRVLGHACANGWKPRAAYRHAVETSVYLAPAARGAGLGKALCRMLLERLAATPTPTPTPTHAVIAGIALPNPASVRLHERLGTRKVAHLAEVGFKQVRWVDVAYWQTTLGGLP